MTCALEWQDNNQRRTDVLRGPELTAAEGWLAISQSMDPQSAELHDDYITFSRATVNRLQRFIYTSIGLAFVIMLGLSIFSYLQSDLAKNERLERERLEALKEVQSIKRTSRISQARSLAAFALLEMNKDPALSLILSLEAVKVTRNADSSVLPLAHTVLRQSIIKSRVRLTLKGHEDGVRSAVYSPDGARIVTAIDDSIAKVWDANTGQELITLKGHEREVFSAV